MDPSTGVANVVSGMVTAINVDTQTILTNISMTLAPDGQTGPDIFHTPSTVRNACWNSRRELGRQTQRRRMELADKVSSRCP